MSGYVRPECSECQEYGEVGTRKGHGWCKKWKKSVYSWDPQCDWKKREDYLKWRTKQQ